MFGLVSNNKIESIDVLKYRTKTMLRIIEKTFTYVRWNDREYAIITIVFEDMIGQR
jgi:hypothetical protein